MATNTVQLQGVFTGTGSSVSIPLESGVSYMNVYNTTAIAAAANPGIGCQFYWQLGFPVGGGIEWYNTDSTNALNVTTLTSGGFTLVDTSLNPVGALNNGSTGISAISTANPPVATVGSTAGMAPGNVVRIYNTAGAQQLGGIDFTIGLNTFNATHFDLSFMSVIAAGTTGSFAQIKWDPLFYPTKRFITQITKASLAVVTLSVTHTYVVGQSVRMVVPPAYGMTQMNGILANILAIDIANNTITINVDSTSFTTFAFPLTAAVPFTPALTVPVGEETDAFSNPNLLDDATVNIGYTGITLGGGPNGPAGQANDVIWWVAGKTFNT